MFPELVVVWAAVTETVGLEITKFPAAFVVADTVAVPVELRSSTNPRETIGAALVKPVEASNLTVAALITPVPVVLMVEAALVIETPCAAVRFDVVFFVYVAPAPEIAIEILPVNDVTFAF
jgi:hypothetical protein